MSVRSRTGNQARCIVIAGPNGAGKTTFAREFLPTEAGVMHFVNADLIAGGLSPLKPEKANVAASRVFLAELDRLVHSKENFEHVYRQLADCWSVYDNSGSEPILLERGP